MYSDRRYFWSGVTDTHPRDPRLAAKFRLPRGVDIKIALCYYKIYGRSWINAPDATVFDCPNLVARRLVLQTLSALKDYSKRSYYVQLMAKKLAAIGVPGHEQLDVLEKIFDVIDDTVPGNDIIVFLGDVTIQLLDNVSDLEEGDVTLPSWINGQLTDDQKIMLQRLMMESRGDVPRNTPANLSSVHDLEKVRHDSLEAGVGKISCTICMEGLEQFDAAEEGNDRHRMIARLPCSHIYHEDCVVRWLETNQTCPLCRTPVVEMHKASKPSFRSHWPVLMVSAVGMLTATLFFRLLNRSQRRNNQHIMY